MSLAAFCREQLAARAAQVGKMLEELATWRPALAVPPAFPPGKVHRDRDTCSHHGLPPAGPAPGGRPARQGRSQPRPGGRWKQEYQRALDKERTAASWVAWRDDRVTQTAVAWVLTCVFLRFCEDNGLVAPVWIAGPENRRQERSTPELAFFRAHPEDTDREWLQSAIDYLAGLACDTGTRRFAFSAASRVAVR